MGVEQRVFQRADAFAHDPARCWPGAGVDIRVEALRPGIGLPDDGARQLRDHRRHAG